jgi:hypothetical protein
MKIDWNTLQSRLSGEVVVAGAPGYEVASEHWVLDPPSSPDSRARVTLRAG